MAKKEKTGSWGFICRVMGGGTTASILGVGWECRSGLSTGYKRQWQVIAKELSPQGLGKVVRGQSGVCGQNLVAERLTLGVPRSRRHVVEP